MEFSIKVEEVFQISNREGIILIGITSGIIKIGDYLVDVNDKTKQYKVIGIEMLRFANRDKNFTHNPAILIQNDTYEPTVFKDKILESQVGLLLI